MGKKILWTLVILILILASGAVALYLKNDSTQKELIALEKEPQGWCKVLVKADSCQYPLCGWLLADFKNTVSQNFVNSLQKWENDPHGWQKIIDLIAACQTTLPTSLTDYRTTATHQLALAKEYHNLYTEFQDKRAKSNTELDQIYAQYGDYDFAYEGGKNCALVKKQSTYVTEWSQADEQYIAYVGALLPKITEQKTGLRGANQTDLDKILSSLTDYHRLLKEYHAAYLAHEQAFTDLLEKECAGQNIEAAAKEWEGSAQTPLDELNKKYITARESAETISTEFFAKNGLQ